VSELVVVTELVKEFATRRGSWRSTHEPFRAVDEVSFSVTPGQTLAVVGESGSGKSTMARCVGRLLTPTSGSIVFDGRDITRLSMRQMRPLRSEISFVFQDPFSSLDPRQQIGAIVGEPLRIHGVVASASIAGRVAELLELVGLESTHATRYPHEFSGGQRQRIGIARALATNPRLVICDEPVSALDVSVQAQILNLLSDLQERLGLTYIFISHDLGVVRHIADRVAVMQKGKIVEEATRDELFAAPSDPYTKTLLAAVPVADPDRRPARPA
jgi:ABC-type oligopeptide transport system ATPase subunit